MILVLVFNIFNFLIFVDQYSKFANIIQSKQKESAGKLMI